MKNTAHLEIALGMAREQLALAERRRPSTTSGPAGGVAERKAQVERFRAKVERLERLLKEATS